MIRIAYDYSDRLDRKYKRRIRREIRVEEGVLTFIEEKRRKRYGHVRGVNREIWINIVKDWSPVVCRRRDRPDGSCLRLKRYNL